MRTTAKLSTAWILSGFLCLQFLLVGIGCATEKRGANQGGTHPPLTGATIRDTRAPDTEKRKQLEERLQRLEEENAKVKQTQMGLEERLDDFEPVAPPTNGATEKGKQLEERLQR